MDRPSRQPSCNSEGEHFRKHLPLSIALETPIFDHKLHMNISPLIQSEQVLNVIYLFRRTLIPASTGFAEKNVKKAKTTTTVIRKVVIPAKEVIHLTFTDWNKSWHAIVDYDIHNVHRRKGSKDESWPRDVFIETVNGLISNPEHYPAVNFTLHAMGDNLSYDIKESKDGISVQYVKTILMKRMLDSEHEAVISSLKGLIAGQFSNSARAGNVSRAKLLIEQYGTYIDIDAEIEGNGWNVVQLVSYFGHYDFLLWLVDELGAYPLSHCKRDGYSALHLACMKGHVNVATLLVERGASILDETLTSGGQTAIDMMVQYGHTDMVRAFVGPESAYTAELLTSQGVRNTELSRMYNVLKSSPLIVMRRASIYTEATSLQLDGESLASSANGSVGGKSLS